MSGMYYANRTPRTSMEVAMVFLADFAAICKADGDMANYYRFRNVLRETSLLFRNYQLIS